jgi:hypothetical protein
MIPILATRNLSFSLPAMGYPSLLPADSPRISGAHHPVAALLGNILQNIHNDLTSGSLDLLSLGVRCQ